MFKTIIISDFHLGTPEAKFQELLAFLDNNPCENLIINGDLIDELYLIFFSRWKEKHAYVIEHMKAICKKNQTKIFYLQGNHEVSLHHMPYLRDFDIQQEMIYSSHGKKYYICHGHQFESVNRNRGFLTYLSFLLGSPLWMFIRIYGKLRSKLGLPKRSLLRPLKRIAQFLLGGKKNIHRRIQKKAIEEGCHGIMCGHFHEPEDCRLGNIHYLNSGEWIEICSAITQDHAGHRKIVYPKNGNI